MITDKKIFQGGKTKLIVEDLYHGNIIRTGITCKKIPL